MALINSEINAQRMGVDLRFYEYDLNAVDNGYKGSAEPIVIDFINNFSISPESNSVFATGGRNKKQMVEFKDSPTGTASIETQMTNVDLLNMIAGIKPSEGSNKVTWKADQNKKTLYWVVEGDTVGKNKAGDIVYERIILHKASISESYNPSYTGDGDPQSITVELSLLCNEDDEFFTIVRDDEEIPLDEDTTTP